MNLYLITDMPGTPRSPRVGLDEVRFTALNRAIAFFNELCTELTSFIHDFAHRYLSADGQHIMNTFTAAYARILKMMHKVRNEHDKREVLQQLKICLNDLLKFYRNCDLGATDAPDITKWRWVKLRERVEKWQQTADKHNWEYALEIKPKRWREPWWNGGSQHWGVNLYLITDMPGTPRSPRVGLDEVRFTSLNNAIAFYDDLCTYLGAVIHDPAVYNYLSDDGQHIVRTFTHRRQKISSMMRKVKNEHDKRELLQQLKIRLNDLLRFYRNCDLGTTDAPNIAKWRWVKLRERAEEWQQTADTHDWKDALEIKPRPWNEPWWDGGSQHWGVPEAERFI